MQQDLNAIDEIDLTRSKGYPSGFRVKLLRALWTYGVWPLLVSLPRVASPARVFALRLFGAKIGKRCLIESGVKVWLPWNLILGDYVAIGRNVEIYNYGVVRVGTMTCVSQYCYLCTGTHDFTHPHMPLVWDDISVGQYCWIAAGAWILPGVNVGEGTVVGARSLVTKSLPPWTISTGSPCRPVRERRVLSAEGR